MYQTTVTAANLPTEKPQGFGSGVVRFYSRIADRSALSKTWHYLRGLDSKGSGWVEFSLTEAAGTLKVSIATIRRHLREGKKEGFINWFKTTGDRATACYVSRDKVCRRLGLNEWGIVAEVFLHDLPASKELATELEAIARQKNSQYMAKKESRRPVTNIDRLLKPSLYTQNLDDESRWGNSTGVDWIGNRFTFVQPDFVAYGTSQAGIGEKMNRHERTIKRRLSNSQRAKNGLEALDRKQIAKKVEYSRSLDLYIQQIAREEVEYSPSLDFYIQMNEKPGKLFRSGGKIYLAMCNVYNPQYDLISMKVARKRFQAKTAVFNDFLRLAIVLGLPNPASLHYLGSNKGQFCIQLLGLLADGLE